MHINSSLSARRLQYESPLRYPGVWNKKSFEKHEERKDSASRADPEIKIQDEEETAERSDTETTTKIEIQISQK